MFIKNYRQNSAVLPKWYSIFRMCFSINVFAYFSNLFNLNTEYILRQPCFLINAFSCHIRYLLYQETFSETKILSLNTSVIVSMAVMTHRKVLGCIETIIKSLTINYTLTFSQNWAVLKCHRFIIDWLYYIEGAFSATYNFRELRKTQKYLYKQSYLAINLSFRDV